MDIQQRFSSGAVLMHWSEKYIGMPYDPASNNCAMFVEKVLSEVFSVSISLPVCTVQHYRTHASLIQKHKDVYASLTDTPSEGDCVLMVGRGRTNHIGVYCEVNGVAFVVHAMEKAGQVCLHRLRDLTKYGLDVEGIYKWL